MTYIRQATNIIGDLQKTIKETNINISYSDVETLLYKYKDKGKVLEHSKEMLFDNKLQSWYKGDRILTNMEEFRAVGLHWEEHSVYIKAARNAHPRSEWMKFWTREKDRSLNGYHIGRDWIPGYYYWYLNYSPIILAKTVLVNNEWIDIRDSSLPYIWDGDYYFFHYVEECIRQKKHGVLLKKRGAGMSFKLASMLTRNYFLIPNSRGQVYAGEKKYINEDGVLNDKAWNIMAHVDDNTEFKKRRTKSTELYRRAGMLVKDNGVEVEVGYKSEIIGTTVQNNPSKARGKRSMLIGYEEFGTMSQGAKVWEVSTPSVEQGTGEKKKVFGLKLAYGTGGEEGAVFEAMNEIITHPISYDVLDVPNIWKAGMEEQRVGYFWPEYINMEGHMDKDGNSYIEEAKEAMLKERAKWKYDRVSSNTVMTRKAERPMTIDEAVLKTGGSPFPVVDLKDRLIDLQTNKIYRGMESIGRLTLNGDASVTWKEDLANELTPIYGLDYDESNRRGATIIYDHPQRKDGEVYKDRYIAGIDPIDFNIDEVGNKYSLMSCYVMDTFTETIVAEYVGRADIAKDGYENIRRLLIYFHAKANYENQLKGIFGYFESRNSMYLLCDTPKILFQKLDMKLSHDRKKGTG